MITVTITYTWARGTEGDVIIDRRTFCSPANKTNDIRKDLQIFTQQIAGDLEESSVANGREIDFTVAFVKGKSDVTTGQSVTQFRKKFTDLVESFIPLGDDEE